MKISIRWALIIGVLGLIWITQLISTTSAYFSSQNVLLHHSRDIMQNIADLTIEQSKNHLNLAQSAAHLTKRLMASEVVSSTYSQLDALERYFLDQLAIYPHFAGIYVGKPNGDFYYVSRDDTYAPNGFRTKIINRQAGDRQTLLKWRDAKGRLVQTTPDPTDTFDPRARPWYRRAMADNTIVWTDPYIFFTSQKPGITIAGPIFHASGGLQAIVGVDIEIDHLSTFISKLRIGKNGRAFMINNNGDVVAFPDVDKLTIRKTQEGDTARLVKISELDDAIAIAAFQAIDWTGRNGDRFELDGPQFARFTYNGRVFDTMFTPFVDSKWPWIIGVYLPESDYLGGIRSNRRFNVLITLALSFIATLIGLRLVRGIIRPLAALEKEALAIKRRDLTQNHDTGSAFSEIQETADAFTRMKTELRQSEEKYRSIFENIQDIYYEVTLEGQILEVSPSVKKVTHLSRRELIGMSMDTLYEDVSTRQNFLEVIQRVGRVDDFEIRLKDKNGNVLHSAITAVLKRSPEGKPIKIIGSLRVINDRKRAESELLRYQNHLEELVRERTQDHERINRQLLQEVETRREKEDELRKSEEKYRSVIENMDNGYYEMDLKGNLTFFNDPLANMLGYTREEMMRLHYRDYLALDMLAIVQKRLATVRQTGMAAALSRHTLVGKDGRRKTVEASIALITDAEGQPLGYSGVVLDVTMKLDAEREKKKLEERLQQIQRLEGIGTLAGGVAHDFNNLLMGIQGNVSLTLLTTPPGHPNYEKLKNIEACVVGGSDLTRQLLGFARGGKYSSKTMDLNQVV
ncbi:MAG: PAS domain S-box protein, partial [Desulfatitalea sp.]|nr:PAS domain S-box protein [Desulfatitalea sp.]